MNPKTYVGTIIIIVYRNYDNTMITMNILYYDNNIEVGRGHRGINLLAVHISLNIMLMKYM